MTSSRVENSSSRAARKVKLALMGPAFVAAIGYIDPGNFATNIQAGASFGYQLLWVVVWANLMAMLIQVLSAKLGIATGKNLAEQIRDHYPRPVVWFYWVQAEIIAMATDLAEFIGAAIGFFFPSSAHRCPSSTHRERLLSQTGRGLRRSGIYMDLIGICMDLIIGSIQWIMWISEKTGQRSRLEGSRIILRFR